MKNSKGFTLIELLAVIIILGVIMTVAIPNVIATLDRNKKDSMINDALRAITSAKYTMRANTEYEYPDDNTIVILPFKKLENLDLEISPYDTYYSMNDSFVAITNESTDGGDSERVYYVHLVSCETEECSTDDESLAQNRGINLVSEEDLGKSGKYDLIIKGLDLKMNLLTSGEGGKNEISHMISGGLKNVVVY